MAAAIAAALWRLEHDKPQSQQQEGQVLLGIPEEMADEVHITAANLESKRIAERTFSTTFHSAGRAAKAVHQVDADLGNSMRDLARLRNVVEHGLSCKGRRQGSKDRASDHKLQQGVEAGEHGDLGLSPGAADVGITMAAVQRMEKQVKALGNSLQAIEIEIQKWKDMMLEGSEVVSADAAVFKPERSMVTSKQVERHEQQQLEQTGPDKAQATYMQHNIHMGSGPGLCADCGRQASARRRNRVCQACWDYVVCGIGAG